MDPAADSGIARKAMPPGARQPPLVVMSEPDVHLLRRLGAMLYDTLLLLAVLFVAALPLPLIPESIRFDAWVRYTTLAYLLAVSFAFFGWFWTHGGQTLGMRAWRIRVVAEAGAPLSWRLAGRRFAWALLSWGMAGLGFLWSLVDPQRLAWHDRLSGTRLISLAAQQGHAGTEENQRR